MKLTIPLNHAKYFWWGKGWGQKPRKNTDNFYYKMQWKAKAKRPLEVIKSTLPEGAKPIDPNKYVKRDLEEEFQKLNPFILPWPYSERPIKGTRKDPNYKEKSALVYQRHKRIIEPINLPLYFTNSILENDLPDLVRKFQSSIKIEDKFVDYFKRRVECVLFNDSALRKLPINKEFPYMDQNPPRVYGATINRKENHLLQTLYDISNIWNSRFFSFNPSIILQRFSHPHCIYPINRDGKFALLDLECDFVSLLSPVNSVKSFNKSYFDPNFKSNARNKLLKSIDPISWEIGFDIKNFYLDDFEFKIPPQSEIQTIFLSNNNVRLLDDEDYQGRSVMFCYGYAIQQAKYMNDDGSSKLPLTIQCIYTSPKDFKIGFVLFQLNSLDFGDDEASIRNQVWFSQPRSIMNETHEALLDLVTMQSFRINQIPN